jgi:hypothetical protein
MNTYPSQPIQKLQQKGLKELPLVGRKRSYSSSSLTEPTSFNILSNNLSDSGFLSMASTENQHMDSFGDKSSQENHSSPCSGHTTQKLTTQRSVPAFLNKLYK